MDELLQSFDPEEIDVFAELGIGASVSEAHQQSHHLNDPLEAFMDDENEMLETRFAHVDVEKLLKDLAIEALQDSNDDWGIGDAQLVFDFTSAQILKDRDAYHLALIVEMQGGPAIRPFATIIQNGEEWRALEPPTSLSERWHPLYNPLKKALSLAIGRIQTGA